MFAYNPQYYPQQYMPQTQRYQNLEQQYSQFSQQPQPNFSQNPQPYPQQALGLQGKSVESLDVVKAMDIPLDGSISYFPLTDGSAIITKQLQQDGTSKTIIYKPFTEPSNPIEPIKYVTQEEVKEMIENNSESFLDLQDDIEDMRRELRNVNEELKELRKQKDAKRKSDE